MPEYVTGENPSGKKVLIRQEEAQDWNARPAKSDDIETQLLQAVGRCAEALEAIAQNTKDLASSQGNVPPPDNARVPLS